MWFKEEANSLGWVVQMKSMTIGMVAVYFSTTLRWYSSCWLVMVYRPMMVNNSVREP